MRSGFVLLYRGWGKEADSLQGRDIKKRPPATEDEGAESVTKLNQKIT
jgi:hypothetical protein